MFSLTANAQSNSSINIYNSVYIGCSTGQNPNRKSFTEYIAEGLCMHQCKNNRGDFFISSYPYPPTNTIWTVTGGVIHYQDADDCKIVWGSTSTGSISITTVVNGATISFPTLCVDLKNSPQSSFTVAPAIAPIVTQTFTACKNQTINFTDLSVANGGSPINNRVWNFGDGTFSSDINPSHTYTNDGTYIVTNYVSDACNCNSQAELTVKVKNQSVDITCPSVVCQGDKTTYVIGAPYNHEGCTNYDWSVTGGIIVSPAPYTDRVDILWDNLRTNDGFGYVNFNPSTCNTGCYSPTTIKVPIIKSDYQPIMWEGAALNSNLNNIPDLIVPICGSTQQKFKMPQWPSTEFTWEIINTATAPPTTANYVLTDQRNEIYLNPGTTAGTVTLKCTYFNTLLKCGGIATRKINISQTVAIAGPDTACLTGAASYTSSSGTSPTWTYRLLPNGIPTGTFVGGTYEPVFPSAGQYEILLTTANSCGNTSKLVTVVGVPTITANQLVGNTTICQGTPSTFSINNTVPNTIIGWQVTNGTITGSNYGSAITANFNNVNPAIYNLTVWRESILPPFCKSASTTIPLLQTIIDTTIVGSIAPCGSTTATYTNPSTNADNLEWLVVPANAGNILGVNNTNTVQVLWNEAIAGQTTSIRLKISKCNRTVVAALPVTISNPQIVLSTPLLTFCGGIAQPFTVTAVTPLTAGTVTWNFGDGIIETTANSVFTTTHVFNNATTSNASYAVTATIANPNGCSVTIIKTLMVTVKPSPIAKITPAVDKCSTDFNLILPANRVLVLEIQNSNGVTIKWFKDNAVITGATSTSYTVSSFGTYYATVDNGVCIKTTNAVKFFLCSGPVVPCDISPTPNIAINTITSTCGAMSATASYAGTAISKKWTNLATNAVLSTTNVMNNWVTEPGSYLYSFEASFTSTSGQPCTLNNLTTIIVPYIIDLKTDVTCPSTTAGQYNVTLFDFSKIYPVTPITSWQFYVNNVLKAKNTTLGDLDTNRHITLAPGTYTLKLVVGAVGQAPCTKTITLVLPAFPTAVIATGGGTTCPENGMPFTTAPQPGCSYEWTIKKSNELYATNLQQNPTFTFASPSTTLPSLYRIYLKVTNNIGCSATSSITQVTVPAVNLAGGLPLSMGKCQGESANILFQNTGGTIASYQWMNNNVPVPAPAGITNPLVTTTQGAYWVKIGNTEGCKVPIINPKCTVTFAAQNVAIAGNTTYCLTNTVRLTAAIAGGSIAGESNALYEWRRNDITNVLATTPVLEDIPTAVGNYTYTLTLLTPTGSGAYCTSTATQTVAVALAPTITSLYYDTVTCNPYSFKLHATANMPGTFNWSNGQTGADMTTSFGGAYKVLFTSASGCTATALLQTPRSPESYLWEFPSGCFTFCSKIDYSRKFLGPALAQFPSGWVWNALATAPALAPTISGLNAMTPYSINFGVGSYKYDMLLYASPQCSYKSKPAYIQNIGCSTTCNLHTFTQSTANPFKVVPSATNPYLYYQLKFNFLPNEKVIRLININNDGVFVPSTINVPPGGLTNFIIKFIPNSLPYMGPIQIGLTALDRGVYCESFQDIFLSNGPSARVKVGLQAGFTLDLVPNPAKSYVSISCTFIEKDAPKTITIYDLTGRMLKQKVIGSLKDVWEVPTDDLASGQYIVVMKEDGMVVMQKNLLKMD